MQKKTKKIIIAAVAIAAVSGVGLSANAAFKQWGGGMMMRHMDANGDGKVTKAEIMPRITKRFDRVDANSDGQVTKEEIGEHVRKRVEKRVGFMFDRFDSDADGVMTKAEIESQVDKHFARMDTDNNGEVSREEMGAFRDAMRAHMRKFFDQEN
ncbi:MAG: EF-hand domain-containing protein [Pseudomonadota bacterium]